MANKKKFAVHTKPPSAAHPAVHTNIVAPSPAHTSDANANAMPNAYPHYPHTPYMPYPPYTPYHDYGYEYDSRYPPPSHYYPINTTAAGYPAPPPTNPHQPAPAPVPAPPAAPDELDICPVCESECTCGTKASLLSSPFVLPPPAAPPIITAAPPPTTTTKAGRVLPPGGITKRAAPAPAKPPPKIKVKPPVPDAPTTSHTPALSQPKKRGRPTKAALLAREAEARRLQEEEALRASSSSLTDLEEEEEDEELPGHATPRARRESDAFPTFVSAFTGSSADTTTESGEEEEEEEEDEEMGDDTELEAEEERAILLEEEVLRKTNTGGGGGGGEKRRRWAAWEKELKRKERVPDTNAGAANSGSGGRPRGQSDEEEEEDEDEEEEDEDEADGYAARAPKPQQQEREAWSSSEDSDEAMFFAHLSDFSDFSSSFYDDFGTDSDSEATESESSGSGSGSESESGLSSTSLAEAHAAGLYFPAFEADVDVDVEPAFLKKKKKKRSGRSRGKKDKERGKDKDKEKKGRRREKMLLVEDEQGQLVFGAEWDDDGDGGLAAFEPVPPPKEEQGEKGGEMQVDGNGEVSEESSEWEGDGETTDEDDVPGLRREEVDALEELGLVRSNSSGGAVVGAVDPKLLSPPPPVLATLNPNPISSPTPNLKGKEKERAMKPLPRRATMALWASPAKNPGEEGLVVVVDGKEADGVSPFAKIRRGTGLDCWAGKGKRRRESSSRESDASWYYSKRARLDSASSLERPLRPSPSPDPLDIAELLDTSYFLYDESIPSSAAEDNDHDHAEPEPADEEDEMLMRHLTRLDAVPLGQWFRRARAQGAEAGMGMSLSVTAFDGGGADSLLVGGGGPLVVLSPVIFPVRDREPSPAPGQGVSSTSLAAALSPRKARSRKERRKEKRMKGPGPGPAQKERARGREKRGGGIPPLNLGY